MDKYSIQILERALENIDEIYTYIATELLEPTLALKLVDEFENAIFSLETMPKRFPIRKTGFYKNSGYRQIFVQNFIIVYRIDEPSKTVFIVSVKYSKSNF